MGGRRKSLAWLGYKLMSSVLAAMLLEKDKEKGQSSGRNRSEVGRGTAGVLS